MTSLFLILLSGAALALAGPANSAQNPGKLRLYSHETKSYYEADPVRLTPDEWRAKLSPEAYHVLREQGTERPYANKYWDNHEKGIYKCAACETDLYDSDTKYESQTGWPSFWQPIAPENVATREDRSYFVLVRTEVICARCESHLGHVFNDGPPPTGLRYCMNSAALLFVPAKKEGK